ncbi:MAG: ribose 5-phosphate isomerase B, partial [Candidatus Melainabacteria bacterium LEY3_CP_29_8]
MDIIIGCDHGGFNLKNKIIDYFNKNEIKFQDFGTYSNESVDYPEIAFNVAKEVVNTNSKGILICGSGLGMSIAANKVKGARAVCVNDSYMAILSRQHNDSNMMAMGAGVVGTKLALEIVDTWLATDFEGGRHQRRVDT